MLKLLSAIYFFIITGLIILFFVSLFLFIKNNANRSTEKLHELTANRKKLDIIIEQNEKIITLLEKDKES